jgi:hypothetical protein
MQKSYLILNELELILKYWEQLNLFAKSIHKISEFTSGKPLLENIATYIGVRKPIIGTELDNRGFLVREIRDFQKLRTCLENELSVDYNIFLPRVPTEIRDILPRIDFARSRIKMREIFFFPYIISRWLEYKKVFSIENASIIESIPLYTQNYLHLVPFKSFLLRFEDGLSFHLSGSGDQRQFGSCLCSFDDNMLDIFCLAPNTEDYLMTNDQLSFFSRMNNGKKIDLKFLQKNVGILTSFDPGVNKIPVLKISIHIPSGRMFADRLLLNDENNKQSSTLSYIDIYSHPTKVFVDSLGEVPQESTPADLLLQKDFLAMIQFIVDKVNGFCYTFSQLRSSEQPQTVIHKPAPHKTIDDHDFGWNAIPITQTQFIRLLEDEKSERRVVISYGNEKSPHYRRGHWRITINKDGTTHQVWIKETLVRADKLEIESLKGSVTKVKDKEK